jgi:hypothetical protein
MNLFTAIVGESGKGRKGTSWGHIRRLISQADSGWKESCVKSGLTSGEGLIWAVRDPLHVEDSGSPSPVEDPGVTDKRLCAVETEFAQILKTSIREGNTLSPVIRAAWDTGDLTSLSKNKPGKSTGAYISIIGHITRQELLRYLSDTESANGFGNRFLWVCARRSKLLPMGGCLAENAFSELVTGLSRVVRFVRQQGVFQVLFDKEALTLWEEGYPHLSRSRPGLLGCVTGRAEPLVLRLALIYACFDQFPIIRLPHLRAALAAWDYCEASARHIFGDAFGDQTIDRLLEALLASPKGLSKTEVSKVFQGNKSALQINSALGQLQDFGKARVETTVLDGHRTERWFAVATR